MTWKIALMYWSFEMTGEIKFGATYRMRVTPSIKVHVMSFGRIDLTMCGFNRSAPAVFVMQCGIITAYVKGEFLERFELMEAEQ